MSGLGWSRCSQGLTGRPRGSTIVTVTFGENLRRQLAETYTSIRSLAYAMNPERPESARRELHRILAGAEPRRATRQLIGETLRSMVER